MGRRVLIQYTVVYRQCDNGEKVVDSVHCSL